MHGITVVVRQNSMPQSVNVGVLLLVPEMPQGEVGQRKEQQGARVVQGATLATHAQ
jgi:hypothetical protein